MHICQRDQPLHTRKALLPGVPVVLIGVVPTALCRLLALAPWPENTRTVKGNQQIVDDAVGTCVFRCVRVGDRRRVEFPLCRHPSGVRSVSHALCAVFRAAGVHCRAQGIACARLLCVAGGASRARLWRVVRRGPLPHRCECLAHAREHPEVPHEFALPYAEPIHDAVLGVGCPCPVTPPRPESSRCTSPWLSWSTREECASRKSHSKTCPFCTASASATSRVRRCVYISSASSSGWKRRASMAQTSRTQGGPDSCQVVLLAWNYISAPQLCACWVIFCCVCV